MRFRRRRHRPQLDLAALDRLSEAIARTLTLLEERLTERARRPSPVELVIRRPPPPEAKPPPPAPVREPETEPEPKPEPPEPEPEPEAFVLFVPTVNGYRLVAHGGPTPERGERLRVEELWYRVLRLGPSPLPGDARRCAFLEEQMATLE